MADAEGLPRTRYWSGDRLVVRQRGIVKRLLTPMFSVQRAASGTRRGVRARLLTLAVVGACSACIVVLVYDHFDPVNPIVLALATLIIVLAFAQGAMALRSEREARSGSTLLDAMDAAVMAVDDDGFVTHWSAGAQQLYGYAAGDVIGRRARDIVFPHECPELLERLRASVCGGERRTTELRARTKHGDELTARIRLSPLTGANRSGIVTVSVDVEDERRAESESRLLAALVESTSDAIISKAPDGTIQSWNRGAEQLYGYTAEQAVGRDIGLIVPADRRVELDRIFAAVHAGERIENLETERVTKDGRLIEVALTISPILDDDSRALGASIIARDITSRRRMERELRVHAEYDELTGLYNRRRFEDELRRVTDAGTCGAVILLDLDHFKFVNDLLGHSGGDELLRGVGRVMKDALGTDGLAARLGGDEFIVLLPGGDEQVLRGVAERLLSTIRSHEFTVPVTATAGLAIVTPDEGLSPEGVLVAADVALHEAKESGRDRMHLYSGQRGEGLTWTKRLRDALDTDAFQLHAQPIFDLAEHRVTQVELLVRMHNETGEIIGPAAFLPTAERFGLIKELDRWIIRRGLAVASEGQRVEINLSGRSFADPRLPGWIEEEMAAAGADPANVVFEITETAVIANMEEARRFVDRLRRLGCGFALDDFGTGFGSLTYLKHLPVDYLKIDREFVRDLPRSEADQRIVRSVVTIAREHGMRTVAEGVEDVETLDRLRSCGVDLAQGFHLGRPRPLRDELQASR